MSSYIRGHELEQHKKYESQYKLENEKSNIFWGQ